MKNSTLLLVEKFTYFGSIDNFYYVNMKTLDNQSLIGPIYSTHCRKNPTRLLVRKFSYFGPIDNFELNKYKNSW